MSYVGRIAVRCIKDAEAIEVLGVEVKTTRGWRGDTIADCGLPSDEIEDFISDILRGRSDAVYEIQGTYHEEYHQDYWGEWDGSWEINDERIFCRGRLAERRAKKGE